MNWYHISIFVAVVLVILTVYFAEIVGSLFVTVRGAGEASGRYTRKGKMFGRPAYARGEYKLFWSSQEWWIEKGGTVLYVSPDRKTWTPYSPNIPTTELVTSTRDYSA